LEPVLAGLDDALRAVQETEGQASFRQRFPQLFRRLAENPVVGEVWRAFAPTLAPAPGSDDAMGYTRRPQESFNESLLAIAGINLRFYNAVPNLLVGAGLLFTFIGLVAALYFASAGVAATDVVTAQFALRELLAAATFKFITSIAGLGSSLVFSWGEKAQLHRVQRRLTQLCSALEARMVPVTGESVAGAQLAEMRQQTVLLRRLSRDLFVRLPEGVEEGLTAEIGRAVAPLRDALTEAAPSLRRIAEPILDLLAADLDTARSALSQLSAAVPAGQPLAPPQADPERALGAVQQVSLRLEAAGETLRASISRLIGMARDPRRGPQAKPIASLLADAQQNLATAQDAARELETILGSGGALGPASNAGLETAMHDLVSRIDGGVNRAADRLSEAIQDATRLGVR
jgi:hypothetical protein